MKKIVFLVASIALLAAACNSSQTTQTNPPPPTAQTENASQAKVDAAVNTLNSSVDSEQTANLSSNDDVINSDQSVINGYKGVTNVTY